MIHFYVENTSEEAGNTFKLSFKGAKMNYTHFKILEMKTTEEAEPLLHGVYLDHFMQLFCSSLFSLHYLYTLRYCANTNFIGGHIF